MPYTRSVGQGIVSWHRAGQTQPRRKITHVGVLGDRGVAGLVCGTECTKKKYCFVFLKSGKRGMPKLKSEAEEMEREKPQKPPQADPFTGIR